MKIATEAQIRILQTLLANRQWSRAEDMLARTYRTDQKDDVLAELSRLVADGWLTINRRQTGTAGITVDCYWFTDGVEIQLVKR